jgi:hypothetical protein
MTARVLPRRAWMVVGLTSALLTLPTLTASAHDPTQSAPLAVPAVRATASGQALAPEPPLAATPQAPCDPALSHPETDIQGRVPLGDYESGRVKEGYRCNAELVGSFVPTSGQGEGGLKVERYVDADGHECAYYDTTQLFPTNVANEHGLGVYVLDMADPSHPVQTTTLTTPAMLTPHESLVLNQKRGLLVAVAGNLFTAPGLIDVYDVTKDCRHPEHLSSTPTGILGHESGFAPDGRTFYAASFSSETIVAVDLDDPSSPKVLGAYNIGSHGISVSDDGNRLYVAALDLGDTAEIILKSPVANLDPRALLTFDSSEIQARKPNPQLRLVSALTWSTVSTPQVGIPITIGGHRYVVEVDEFGALSQVGAGRIIDFADEMNPFVVSNLRLAVHQPENFERIAGDPSAQGPEQTFGYSAHYCNVPSRVDPGLVACDMIGSGLRVFDIRDPLHPREVAYFNAPILGGTQDYPHDLSSPTFVPARREIWYTDIHGGFYAVRLSAAAWPTAAATAARPLDRGNSATEGRPQSELPKTGGRTPWAPIAACLVAAAAVLSWIRRSRTSP